MEIKLKTLNTVKAIEILLFAEYYREFEVIDGVNRHRNGTNYYEWLYEKKLISKKEAEKIEIKLEQERQLENL